MGWTREEASAEGCSSRRAGVFMSMCTKGEPHGDRRAGNKVCPPQSHIVTAQPCSPACSVILAVPFLEPSCSWEAPSSALCIFRCPHGLVGSPQVSWHGVRANPAHGEGGTAESLWLLREGGLHHG